MRGRLEWRSESGCSALERERESERVDHDFFPKLMWWRHDAIRVVAGTHDSIEEFKWFGNNYAPFSGLSCTLRAYDNILYSTVDGLELAAPSPHTHTRSAKRLRAVNHSSIPHRCTFYEIGRIQNYTLTFFLHPIYILIEMERKSRELLCSCLLPIRMADTAPGASDNTHTLPIAATRCVLLCDGHLAINKNRH